MADDKKIPLEQYIFKICGNFVRLYNPALNNTYLYFFL